MSSKDENEKLKEEKETLTEESENENENENEDEDDETMSQNKKNKTNELNDHLDEIIDKSKSFEDEIKFIRKVKNLDYYYYYVNDFCDKELKFKIFKLKLAHLSNKIDEDLFKQIFDHHQQIFETLANKLMNTTNKEENQTIVKNIEKNKDKVFEIYEFNDWVIQPSNQCINLKDY